MGSAVGDCRGAGRKRKAKVVGMHVVAPKARARKPLLDRKAEELAGFAVDEIALPAIDIAAPKNDLRGFDELARTLFAAIEGHGLGGKAAVDDRRDNRDAEHDRCDSDDRDDAERRNLE